MWWEHRQWWKAVAALDKLAEQHEDLAAMGQGTQIYGRDLIHPTVILDDSKGPIHIGHRVRISPFVCIQGPIVIENDVTIGKSAQIRGPSHIGKGVLIGSFAEIKRSILWDGVSIGPGSYVGDSYIDEGVFFGAHVRTSNYRQDGGSISVMVDGERVDTGMNKLGCYVGKKTFLGVGCKIYPGREVPPDSLFEMDVHIKKNLDPGHYWVKQDLGFKPLT